MENKLLEDYLNREGGNYVVVNYKTFKNEVLVVYRNKEYQHTAQIEIPLFYLISFVYSNK